MSRRFELYGTDLLGGGLCVLAVALLPMSGLLDETGLQQRMRQVAQRQALGLAPAQAAGPAERGVPALPPRRVDRPG